VTRLLEGPLPVARRQRLAVVAGHLAGLVGSLAFDLRDEGKALAYFKVAVQAADDAGSPDLAAWALATRSLIPTYTGDPAAALRLLQEAQDRARGHVSASRLAWLAALEARAQAGLGDAAASLTALGRADRAIERAKPEGGRFANDFFDRPRLVGFRGTSHLLLGQSKPAQAALADAWPSACVTSASRSWSPPRASRAWATIARPPAAGLLRRRDRGAAVPRPGAVVGAGRTGAGLRAQLGAGLLRPPGGWPRPAWGNGPASTLRPCARPSPARPGSSRPANPSTCASCPRPAVAPEPVEVAATIPLADDTIPLPAQEPAPVGIAAAVALASRTARRVGQRVGRRRERGGRLPSPARRPWLPVRLLPGRGRR
jgi:hypothetical protein